MAFESIKPVEKAQTYLDIAFKKAVRRTKQKSIPKGDVFNKVKTIEINKISISKDILSARLKQIIDEFPCIDELNPYYLELLKITLGTYELRKSLKQINFAIRKTNELGGLYTRSIKQAKSPAELNRAKKQYYARVSSVMRGVDSALKFLITARIALQSFPTIRERLKKVAIAGFPNVGKSTLLSKLSSSKPDIQSYAFTTKKIMIGYVEEKGKKVVQLLDTPGTLNRLDKMNNVEKQAYLVMKMVADEIIYVFDLTEPYPLEDQVKLYEKISGFGKPMTIYLSKTDIIGKQEAKEFCKRFEAVIDIKKLKEKLKE